MELQQLLKTSMNNTKIIKDNIMIVCCGEALIDMIPTNCNNETAYVPKIGGAVLNTSIALGRLGADVSFLGSISSDVFGDMIIDELKNSKVSTSLCISTSCHTTLAFATIKDGTTTYSFFDENSSNKNISLKDTVLKDEATSLYIGGISLMSEPNGSEIETFINKESSNKVVFFDPNIRPGFIKDKASYMKRFKNILSQTDIIKVSHEDLQWLCPNESFDDVCKDWLELGVSLIIFTLGSEGAMIQTKQLSASAPGRKVKVADTIGAGDIFNAGFLFSLSKDKNFSKTNLVKIEKNALEESLNFAIKTSAISVSRVGANAPFIKEVEEF